MPSSIVEIPHTPYPGRTPAAPQPSPAFAEGLEIAHETLAGRTVWHVNSTATGGGVAELLFSFLRRHNELGIRTRWLVADADADFFAITKQLYHLLYGTPGDGVVLDGAAAQLYREVTAAHAIGALGHVAAGDVVVLHDPQTIGMAPTLAAAGVRVIWQCHLGSTIPHANVGEAWRFVEPYLDAPASFVFSHPRYVPDRLAGRDVHVIMPAIDPVSAKNRPLEPPVVAAVLGAIGLAPTPDPAAVAEIEPATGRSPAWMAGLAAIVQGEQLPPEAPVLLQISRWDHLKDMAGVLRGFAEGPGRDSDAHVVLAGPDPGAIADDPGAIEVFAGVRRLCDALPDDLRRRVHLVATSAADLEGTAFVINALQQRADIVTQKSLREGFGLTIAEGKIKSKPVIAGDAGGMPLQVVEGETGLLVDPADLTAFGEAVGRLLDDPHLRARIGSAGQDDCRQRFLMDRQLHEYLGAFRAAVDLGGVSIDAGITR